MSSAFLVALIFPGLFGLIFLSLELGRYLKLRQRKKGLEPERAGTEVVEGAIFGLMALLIAFTFSGASSRFDARRQTLVEEANIIRAAYLRIDMLPVADQPGLRDKFRKYLDNQVAMYQAIPDFEAFEAGQERSAQLQKEIWGEAVTSAMAAGGPTAIQVPGVINSMFDVATKRYMSIQFHTPLPILSLLVFLICFCGLLAGSRMAGDGTRKWNHMVIFAALMSLTIYMIVDFEFPRVGLISLEKYDEILLAVRAGMH